MYSSPARGGSTHTCTCSNPRLLAARRVKSRSRLDGTVLEPAPAAGRKVRREQRAVGCRAVAVRRGAEIADRIDVGDVDAARVGLRAVGAVLLRVHHEDHHVVPTRSFPPVQTPARNHPRPGRHSEARPSTRCNATMQREVYGNCEGYAYRSQVRVRVRVRVRNCEGYAYRSVSGGVRLSQSRSSHSPSPETLPAEAGRLAAQSPAISTRLGSSSASLG